MSQGNVTCTPSRQRAGRCKGVCHMLGYLWRTGDKSSKLESVLASPGRRYEGKLCLGEAEEVGREEVQHQSAHHQS